MQIWVIRWGLVSESVAGNGGRGKVPLGVKSIPGKSAVGENRYFALILALIKLQYQISCPENAP